MTRLQIGHRVQRLELPGIDGGFKLEDIKGKRFLLSFHRFAACPFCNLHIHQLIQGYDQLGANFEIVAIFDSPLDNLKKHAMGHNSPFPILADEENIYYREFSVERSIAGTLIGMLTRMPTLLYAMFIKRYFPVSFKGNITTMPLDLLVNEEGIVEHVYYGKDESDHLPIETIHAYSKDLLQ